MINQLWQGKQVSLDSSSFLHSTSACLPQPSQAGGGFWGAPVCPPSPSRQGMKVVKKPCHSCTTNLTQGSRAAAQLPLASSRPSVVILF